MFFKLARGHRFPQNHPRLNGAGPRDVAKTFIFVHRGVAPSKFEMLGVFHCFSNLLGGVVFGTNEALRARTIELVADLYEDEVEVSFLEPARAPWNPPSAAASSKSVLKVSEPYAVMSLV